MDATRSDPGFLADVLRVAIAAGATTINVPDTVGYTLPSEFAALIDTLYDMVPELADVVLSVHCHNDLGLAVANSLAAVEHGATQVEVAVNGLGERAGNAALEELAMALVTRRDVVQRPVNIVTTEIARTSRLVSNLTGYQVQPNKAVVGKNAFAHESGIHQDGVLKERTTYEIMHAQDVGLGESDIVLGKHSGRHALKSRLAELGIRLDGAALDEAFRRFKEIADKKKQVTTLDLEALATEEIREREDLYSLTHFYLAAGSEIIPTGQVEVHAEGRVLEGKGVLRWIGGVGLPGHRRCGGPVGQAARLPGAVGDLGQGFAGRGARGGGGGREDLRRSGGEHRRDGGFRQGVHACAEQRRPTQGSQWRSIPSGCSDASRPLRRPGDRGARRLGGSGGPARRPGRRRSGRLRSDCRTACACCWRTCCATPATAWSPRSTYGRSRAGSPRAEEPGGDPVHAGPGAPAGLHRGALRGRPRRHAGGGRAHGRRPADHQPARARRPGDRSLRAGGLLRHRATRAPAT